jgi:hypothetical protein
VKTHWTIRNIDEIKGTPRSPLIIHVNAEQWKRVIAGLEPGREVPAQAFVLTGIPDPSVDIFLYSHCPEEGPHTTVRWSSVGGREPLPLNAVVAHELRAQMNRLLFQLPCVNCNWTFRPDPFCNVCRSTRRRCLISSILGYLNP